MNRLTLFIQLLMFLLLFLMIVINVTEKGFFHSQIIENFIEFIKRNNIPFSKICIGLGAFLSISYVITGILFNL